MALRVTPGTLVVVIVIFLLIFSPSSSPSWDTDLVQAKDILELDWYQLNVSRAAKWEDFDPVLSSNDTALNLTGFRENDGFYWSRLPAVKRLARSQLSFAASRIIDESAISETTEFSTLVYKNISGWADGPWVRSDLEYESSNVPVRVNRSAIDSRIALAGRPLSHNITDVGGSLHISLTERANDHIGLEGIAVFGDVSAHLTIEEDSSSSDGFDYVLKGIHDRQSGSVILTTTSQDFAGIFALAHMALLPSSYKRMKPYLMQSLNDTIYRQEEHLDPFRRNPWGETSMDFDNAGPLAPQCELIVYLQQFSLDPFLLGLRTDHLTDETEEFELATPLLNTIEADIREPNGLFLPSTPPMKFAATLFSPDCGFVLQSKGAPDFSVEGGDHLRGIKWEIRVQRARLALISFFGIMVGQVLLLIRQINDAATPSKKSRISFTTIAMLSMGSGLMSFAFLLLSSVVARLLVLSMGIAFLAFMDGLFFSMRFLLEIWMTQEPERQERRQDGPSPLLPPSPSPSRTPGANADESPNVEDEAVGSARTDLPSPIHAAIEGATPIAVPLLTTGNETVAAATPPGAPTQATFGSVYTRYCLTLLFIAFLSIWAASSWVQILRTAYVNTITVLYLSFWLPQIYRNVVRNCRKAFSRSFILGQSVLRLLPVAYFYGVESNTLFVKTDLVMLSVLACWLWIQIVVLFAQEVVGPRFFVSDAWSWVPPAYEYHPILREDEEGATLPIGLSTASPVDERSELSSSLGSDVKGSDKKGMRSFDCAICMNKIEVPVLPSGEKSVAASDGGTSSSGVSTAMDVLGAGSYMARRLYCVTPCRHIYHTACLENWMSYRLQCPICRESLPPL